MEDALTTFASLVDRFGENRDAEGVRRACYAKLERAKLEIRAGRPEAAIETIDDALAGSDAIDDVGRLSAFLLRAPCLKSARKAVEWILC